MFTVAWMQRHNEFLALLSAGVSTRRVVRPVLVAACLMLTLGILNQEFVLPRIDSFLVEHRVDPKDRGAIDARGAYETNDILLSGIKAYKQDMRVEGFTVVIPQKLGQQANTFLQAREARYDPRAGGWLMYGTAPPELPHWTRTDILDPRGHGKYFLKTSEVDFDMLTRTKNWSLFVSTAQLLREMAKTHSSQQAGLAVIFHMRLTRPILGLILVFMGLAIILRDQNRSIFISTGLCLVLCGIFFVAVFLCKFFGDSEYLSPALAAWLPVFTFGPLSLVMFDAVHT
jgi:lipopolysaccharide export system permease protein